MTQFHQLVFSCSIADFVTWIKQGRIPEVKAFMPDQLKESGQIHITWNLKVYLAMNELTFNVNGDTLELAPEGHEDWTEIMAPETGPFYFSDETKEFVLDENVKSVKILKGLHFNSFLTVASDHTGFVDHLVSEGVKYIKICNLHWTDSLRMQINEKIPRHFEPIDWSDAWNQPIEFVDQ